MSKKLFVSGVQVGPNSPEPFFQIVPVFPDAAHVLERGFPILFFPGFLLDPHIHAGPNKFALPSAGPRGNDLKATLLIVTQENLGFFHDRARCPFP